jgi:hypothetical protein
MRDYNYRMNKQEIFVKRRILNIVYAREYYENSIHMYQRSRRGYPNNFTMRDPEDKWFNYLGEYTKKYRKSYAHNERKWKTEWGEEWKSKYSYTRPKLKKSHIKNINDQIGETYYTINK